MPIVKRSRYSFTDTIARLTRTIVDSGATVFAAIDQSAAAAQAGLSLRPTWLIVFGNPRAGTPLMDAFPLIALELPLKMLVWADGDTVNVAYARMSELAPRHGVTGKDAVVAAVDANLATLCASVA